MPIMMTNPGRRQQMDAAYPADAASVIVDQRADDGKNSQSRNSVHWDTTRRSSLMTTPCPPTQARSYLQYRAWPALISAIVTSPRSS